MWINDYRLEGVGWLTIWTEQDDPLRNEKGEPASVLRGERDGIEQLSRSLSSSLIALWVAAEDETDMITALGKLFRKRTNYEKYIF